MSTRLHLNRGAAYNSSQEAIYLERTKYNVDKDTQKRTCDGIVFDSVLEMRYYRDVLRPLVESGDVVEYELQKPYELQPKFTHDGKTVRAITYVADFFIRYKDGHEEVIDTKGMPDTTAKLKRKMFWYKYPDVQYQWVTYVEKYGGWNTYEYVKKQRALNKLAQKQEEKECL